MFSFVPTFELNTFPTLSPDPGERDWLLQTTDGKCPKTYRKKFTSVRKAGRTGNMRSKILCKHCNSEWQDHVSFACLAIHTGKYLKTTSLRNSVANSGFFDGSTARGFSHRLWPSPFPAALGILRSFFEKIPWACTMPFVFLQESHAPSRTTVLRANVAIFLRHVDANIIIPVRYSIVVNAVEAEITAIWCCSAFRCNEQNEYREEEILRRAILHCSEIGYKVGEWYR